MLPLPVQSLNVLTGFCAAAIAPRSIESDVTGPTPRFASRNLSMSLPLDLMSLEEPVTPLGVPARSAPVAAVHPDGTVRPVQRIPNGVLISLARIFVYLPLSAPFHASTSA